jgi:hypothetical protein
MPKVRKSAGKSYSLGANRTLVAKRVIDGFVVTIKDSGTEKFIELSTKGWLAFAKIIADIDNSVKDLYERRNANFFETIDIDCYVSVTTGFQCVDIRRFYTLPHTNTLKPTRKGIAIRLTEWETMKSIAKQMAADIPELAPPAPVFPDAQQWPEHDHFNLEDYLQCFMCCPATTQDLGTPISTIVSSSTTNDAGATTSMR